MVFFNFLNFFAIFLEFSITRRVGTERNDNFYFFSFSAFSNLFRDNFYFLFFTSFLQPILALNESIMVFFKFLNIFAIFLEISITCRERNRMKILIVSVSHPLSTYFGWKWSHNGIF